MIVKEKTKISTIITFYYGQISFLKELIDSIEISVDSLLKSQKQNLIEHNLIIINDSANPFVEDSLEVFMDDYRSNGISNIVVIHNSTNLGIIGSRLNGLRCVGGSDIVHIIDQDDKIDRNFYSMAYKIFSKNKEISYIVAGTVISINERSEQISKLLLPKSLNKIGNNKLLKKLIYGGNFTYSIGNLIFRGTLVDQIITLLEKFDREIDGPDDAIIQVFLLKSGFKCIFSQDLIFYYRFHDNNYSKEIFGDFRRRSLKGYNILNQMNLFTDEELKFVKRIDQSIKILRRGFKDWKISDWKYLISNSHLLIKFFYYKKIYKRPKRFGAKVSHEK